MEDRLSSLVDSIRDYRMTSEEVAEQRVGFAYGNAPHDSPSTREEVREAVNTSTAPEVLQ
jgi:hypothetical protein